METEISRLARKCGVRVDHLSDVPNLIDAFETFGWFDMANKYRHWYDDMQLRIEKEHTDGSTSSTIA